MNVVLVSKRQMNVIVKIGEYILIVLTLVKKSIDKCNKHIMNSKVQFTKNKQVNGTCLLKHN